MSLLAHVEPDYTIGWFFLILLDMIAGVVLLGGILFWLAFRNRPQNDGMGDETKSVVRERPLASIRARSSECAAAAIVKRWTIRGAIVGFVFSAVGMVVSAIVFQELTVGLILPIGVGTLQGAAVGFCIRYVVARSDARQATIH